MRHLKKSIMLFLFFFTLILNGAELEPSPNLTIGKLNNGLTYYIYKNQNPSEKASLQLVVGSGSLQEDDDQQGLAHFIEHMAFNGTKNYPDNEIIKYLQEIGMNFGADLNAYTGFDRTVYKLQVSTKDSLEFEKSFEILKEWADGISFLPKNLDDEKNIIIEEWRLRQGLYQRLSDTYKKAIYGDSRYSKRFPMGDPEIVKNSTPQLLKRYYKKWYVPENMAVIAVGDFNKEQVGEYIKKYFTYTSKAIPKENPVYRVNSSCGEIYVFTDPELTEITFDITTKGARSAVKDRDTYKNIIIEDLLNNILQGNFDRISKEKSPTINSGYVYNFSLGKNDTAHVTGAILKENSIEDGVSEVVRQLKKSSLYGITERELKIEKEEMSKSMEIFYKNRDSIENEKIISQIVDLYLEEEIFSDIENQFEVFQEVIEEITSEDLKSKAQTIYNNPNKIIFLTAPEKKDLVVPDENLLKNIVEKVYEENTVPPKESDKELKLESKVLKVGKINEIKEKDSLKYYKLSNGMDITLKETDFDKDSILIRFYSKGGSSLMDENGFIASQIAPGIVANSGIGNLSPVEADIFLKGKNISFVPYISDYMEGINIETDKEDLETSFQILHSLLTEPKVDSVIYENFISTEKELLKNRENSPKTLYGDKIDALISQGHERRKPLTTEDLDKISEEDILETFKNRFSNMNDYHMVIVGSTEGTDIEELIKKYLAGLSSKDTEEIPNNLNIKPPSGIVEEKVVKGIDKKVSVTIIYPYQGKYNYENRVKYLGTAKVLDMLLLEEIREKVGGIYTIYTDSDLSPLNYGENYLVIKFNTDPERADEVSSKVKEVLEKALKGEFEDRILTSIQENYEFNYYNILKENRFWIDYLFKRDSFGDNFTLYTPEKYKNTLSKEKILKFMNSSIDIENYLEVRLVPEKSE